jgi:hypothetical protein
VIASWRPGSADRHPPTDPFDHEESIMDTDIHLLMHQHRVDQALARAQQRANQGVSPERTRTTERSGLLRALALRPGRVRATSA